MSSARLNRWKKTTPSLFCTVLFIALLLCACTDPQGSSSQNADTGSVAFSINWPDGVKQKDTGDTVSRAIDCSSAGVGTVTLAVTDANDNVLISNSFTCTAHYGRLDNVPAGRNRSLICTAEDDHGRVVYRGETAGITVTANQVASAGAIDVVDAAAPSLYASTTSWDTPISAYQSIDVGASSKPVFVDIDADGDMDLFMGNSDGSITYYQNTGSPENAVWETPVENYNSINVGDNSSPAFADIDGDGDLDLFVGEYDGTINFFENTGSREAPEWATTSTSDSSITVAFNSAPVFADIDNDGDMDLFVGNSAGRTFFYENSGTASSPVWTDGIIIYSDPYYYLSCTPSLFDVDHDGDMDLFVGEYYGSLSLYENIGTYSDPIWANPTRSYGSISADYKVAPTFTDIDNDGDMDLFVGGDTGTIDFYKNVTPALGISINNGAEETASQTVSISLSARDNIGISGYFVSNTDSTPAADDAGWMLVTAAADFSVTGVSHTLGGSNLGDYTVYTWFRDEAGNISAPASASITITADTEPPQLLLSIAWTEGVAAYGGIDVGSYSAPAMTDVDADGDLDLFLGTSDGTITFYENTGTSDTAAWASPSANYSSIDVGSNCTPAFADIDADGDQDLFVGESYGNIYFVQNTGTADSPVWAPSVYYNGIKVVNYSTPTLADIDADGDMDLFVGDSEGTITFFENTGSADSATWAASRTTYGSIDVGYNSAPFFTDIDDDDDLDLFVGVYDGILAFYENTGTEENPAWAAGSDAYHGIDSGNYSTPVFADIDGDGDPDLLVGNNNGLLSYYDNISSLSNITIADGAVGTISLTVALDISATDNAGVSGYFISNTSTKPAVDDSWVDVTETANFALDDISHTLSGNEDGEKTVYAWFRDAAGNVSDTAWAKIVYDTTPPAPPATVTGYVSNAKTTQLNDDGRSLSITPFFEWSPAVDAGTGVAGYYVYFGTDADADPETDGALQIDTSLEPAATFATGGTYYLLIKAVDTLGNVNTSAFNAFAYTYNESEKPSVSDPFVWTRTDTYYNSIDTGYSSKPAFVDIDNDGDMDLFVGGNSGTLSYYENSGTPGTPGWSAVETNYNSINTGDLSFPVFADIDNDGDKDLFVGDVFGTLHFYENTGTADVPAWADVAPNYAAVATGTIASPTFTDIDDDGDLDLFVGSFDGQIQFFENTGSAEAAAWAPAVTAYNGIDVGDNSVPTFLDMDNDGDMDLFVGNNAGQITFYLNRGTTQSPIWDTGVSYYKSIDAGTSAAPVFVDIDGDGQVDLFIGQYDGVIYLYEGAVTGVNLVIEGGNATTNSQTVSLTLSTTDNLGVTGYRVSNDPAQPALDETGWIDVTAATDFTTTIASHTLADDTEGFQSVYAWFRDEAGNISDTTWDTILYDTTPPVNPATADGYNTSSKSVTLVSDTGYNYDTPYFEWPAATDDNGAIAGYYVYFGTDSSANPATSDLAVYVEANTFTASEPLTHGLTHYLRLKAVDAAGNVAANTFQGFSYLYYDATPPTVTTSLLWYPVVSDYNGIDVVSSSTPALADIDNDGDLDLFVGDTNGTLTYYRNIGTTAMANWTAPVTGYGSIDVGEDSTPTFVDIDDDGDLDLFVGKYDGTIGFYQNTGSANTAVWTEVSTIYNSIDMGSYSAPAFVDIDHDGDADLFVGVNNGTITYYENIGTGAAPDWAAEITSYNGIDSGSYASPTFIDLDLDSDFDMFVGRDNGQILYYKNTGNPSAPVWATGITFNSIDAGYDAAPIFADIDNDGNPDLFVGARDGTIRFYEYRIPSSLVINNSASSTNSLSVLLDIAATDNSVVSGYYLSNNSTPPAADNPAWVSVSTGVDLLARGIAHTLDSGADGSRTVYAWFKDAAGNISNVAQDSIVFDETAPENPATTYGYDSTDKTHVITSDNWYTHNAPHFEWNGASDATSAIAGYYVYFGTDNTADPAAQGTLQTAAAFTVSDSLVAGETYYLLIKTVDAAGNVSSTIYTAFVYEMRGPMNIVGGVATDQAHDVFVKGTYAYVADGNSGLRVFDISDPTAPAAAGTGVDTDGTANGIYISGDFAFVADGANGLEIIDISTPTAPAIVGTGIDTDGTAYGVYVSGDFAYVADGVNGLEIIDISTPASPAIVGTGIDTDGTAYGIYVSGDFAYVADGTNGLEIINVLAPASPSIAAGYNSSGEARSVKVVDGVAYIADWNGGLLTLDVSTPSSPTSPRSINTIGSARGVYVTENHAYVADYSGGLQVINVADHNNLFTVETIQLTAPATAEPYVYNVFVSQSHAYFAYFAEGLQVAHVNDSVQEGFEAGTLDNLAWVSGDDQTWTATTGQAYNGSFAAATQAMSDSQSSYLEVTLDLTVDTQIAFALKTDTEAGNDVLSFSIDGAEQDTWSGNVDWTRVTFPVTAGTHVFRWEYAKDSTGSAGSDTAWIDDISLP